MKIYSVFKVKDMKAKKKEFILDRHYTSEEAALNRVFKLHGEIAMAHAMLGGKIEVYRDFYKTKNQQTYILEKALHGRFTIKHMLDVVERYDNNGVMTINGISYHFKINRNGTIKKEQLGSKS